MRMTSHRENTSCRKADLSRTYFTSYGQETKDEDCFSTEQAGNKACPAMCSEDM